MNLAIKGAMEAGLKEQYIDRLRSITTYSPNADTLARRHGLPKPESLPPITVAQLAQHDSGTVFKPSYVSICGYVLECKMLLVNHRGRDITTRQIRQVCFIYSAHQK